MREIRPSGSEGGVEQANAPSLPLSGWFGGRGWEVRSGKREVRKARWAIACWVARVRSLAIPGWFGGRGWEVGSGKGSLGGGDCLLGGASAEPRGPCADALMKQTSESLSLEATRYLKVAEGYCVSARAGGEQPEAKDQPQTRVNPIRPCSMTSQRTGGICGGVTAPAGVSGEVRGASPAVSHEITRSAWTDGSCGVCGVGMVRMFHKSNQDRWPLRRGAVRRQPERSGDRLLLRSSPEGERSESKSP